jgi:hypothetical protein
MQKGRLEFSMESLETIIRSVGEPFEIFVRVERETIYNGSTDVTIDMVTVTIFLCIAAAHGYDAWCVELILQRCSLTCVTQPENIFVPSLLVHLRESIGYII